MYLGTLANGSGDRQERTQAAKAAIKSACGGGANILPSQWTAGKYPLGQTPANLTYIRYQGTYDQYAAKMRAAGYPPTISRYWFECAGGYPMYWNWRIAQQVKTLVPTAEETAEAFVEEVKKIAPPPPIEKPTVVTPPDSRLAPPPPMPPITTGTVPVDSQLYAPPPPAAVSAAFPLQEAYKRRWLERQAGAAADAMPDDAMPAPEKKPGAGIGMALAAGAAGLLAMVAGG